MLATRPSSSHRSRLIIILKIFCYPFGGYALIKSLKSIANIFQRRKVVRSVWRIAGAGSGAYGGAIGGGMVGSIIPGVGTLIGSIIGGLIGSSIGLLIAKQSARLVSWVYYKRDPDMLNPTSPEGWQPNKRIWGEEYKRLPRNLDSFFATIYANREATVNDNEKKAYKVLRDIIVNKKHPDTFDEKFKEPIEDTINGNIRGVLSEYRQRFFSPAEGQSGRLTPSGEDYEVYRGTTNDLP